MLGNPANQTASQAYGYDNRSRLTTMSSSLGNQSWSYDANSNWTQHRCSQSLALLNQTA